MNIKIMTFNTQHCMNFITREIDFDVMADAIRKVNPDIVGLQEMRNVGVHGDYTDQVGTLAKMLGMNGYFAEALKFGGVDPYGVGLLSKFPIVSACVHGIPDPEVRKYDGYYETRCVLDSALDIGGGKTLNVYVSHFGLNPDEHENAVSTLCSTVKPARSVLMGDFNMTPDMPLIQPLFEKFSDTAKASSCPLLTFQADNPWEKIDYIFTTGDIKALDANVPEIVASDHRPYVSTIEVN